MRARCLTKDQEAELGSLLEQQRQLKNKALAARFGLKESTFDLYKARWLASRRALRRA